MCAFCVIIGDTIPHVLIALFPGVRAIPVISILSYRRAVIIICTLFISYPLSLYRDITKLARASALALVSMVVIVLTVVIKGPLVDQSRKGTTLFLLPHDFGFLQAIGVISFGKWLKCRG
jgi:sodium-coupled neutral amino acid transporter 11